ncbi:hypothetical protein V6N13_041598 [Hibiscus sabdariffa]|uniref:Uncharacterized protein n=1 Tax=Hibiscus sabdariffa TaxID=183260 RepID=A0ABR2RBR3_9ROSI
MSTYQQGQSNSSNVNNADGDTSTRRQPTFGGMTLEDFLIKAGVVRQQCMPPPDVSPPPHHQPTQYGLYQTSNNPMVGLGFVSRPVGFSGTGYQTMHPCLNYGKIGVVSYQRAPSPLTTVCYDGKVDGAGGYGPTGVVAPVSPVSSERICTNQVDNSVAHAIRDRDQCNSARKGKDHGWSNREGS